MPRGIYKNPIERAKRISETCKKRGIGKWMKGRKLSEKTKEKQSKNNARYWLGKKRGKQSKQWKENIKNSLKGKKRPYVSEIMIGNKHGWKGGVTPINKIIRQSLKYRLWRVSVFKRDNYTCVLCKSKKYIQADHIKRFSDYPELRFELSNGRTLCNECHRKTDTWGNKKSISK